MRSIVSCVAVALVGLAPVAEAQEEPGREVILGRLGDQIGPLTKCDIEVRTAGGDEVRVVVIEGGEQRVHPYQIPADLELIDEAGRGKVTWKILDARLGQGDFEGTVEIVLGEDYLAAVVDRRVTGTTVSGPVRWAISRIAEAASIEGEGIEIDALGKAVERFEKAMAQTPVEDELKAEALAEARRHLETLKIALDGRREHATAEELAKLEEDIARVEALDARLAATMKRGGGGEGDGGAAVEVEQRALDWLKHLFTGATDEARAATALPFVAGKRFPADGDRLEVQVIEEEDKLAALLAGAKAPHKVKAFTRVLASDPVTPDAAAKAAAEVARVLPEGGHRVVVGDTTETNPDRLELWITPEGKVAAIIEIER